MAKKQYLSMSNVVYDDWDNHKFEQLKTGYIGDIGEFGYEIVEGIPKTAKLDKVIYVYEDESFPDIEEKELFEHPPQTILTRRWYK